MSASNSVKLQHIRPTRESKTDLDLPNADPNYFTEMSEKEFQQHFEERGLTLYGTNSEGNLRRIFATLSLEIENSRCIPIPFIVDPGAPGHLYFSDGAIKALQNLNLFLKI